MSLQTQEAKESVMTQSSNGNGSHQKGTTTAAGKKLHKPGSSVVAVKAADLGVDIVGPQVDVPDDLLATAQDWLDNAGAYLKERAELYVQRQRAAQADKRPNGVGPEIGQPTVNNSYVAWDIAMFSPIELTGNPNQQPNRIVRGGQLCLEIAVMWTNPTIDVANGFAVPANVQLGNRNFRVSFDRFNYTTGVAGPNITINGSFGPAPVPSIILLPIFFFAPLVATPQLVEFNVTADISDPGQPYAAFASQMLNLDSEPSWFGGFPAAITPGFVPHGRNMAMVYPQ